MNRNVFVCRILSGVITTALLFSSGVSAANPVTPNWNLHDARHERTLTVDYDGSMGIVGGGSELESVVGSTLTVSGVTVSAPASAYENGTAYVVGGAAYDKEARNNKLIISSATIHDRVAIGGATFLKYVDYRLSTGTASGNTVTVTASEIIPTHSFASDYFDIAVPGVVIGGYSDYAYGEANNNTVEISTSTVGGVVGGGLKDHLIFGVDTDDNGELLVSTDMHAFGNKVTVKDNSVVAVVYGAFGADQASNNSVEIDNSTVGIAAGVVQGNILQHNGTQGTSVFKNNNVSIKNGAKVNEAYVFSGLSALATDNTLSFENATIADGGQTITVINGLGKLGPTILNADISTNTLSISNVNTPITVTEAGASLNFAGKASSNTVTLSRVKDFTVSRSGPGGKIIPFQGTVDIDSMVARNVFAVRNLNFTKERAKANPDDSSLYEHPDFNSDYGFLYGGAAFDYTTQENGYTERPVLADSFGQLSEESKKVPEPIFWANGGTNSDYNKLTFTGRQYTDPKTKTGTYTVSSSKVSGNIMGGIAAELREMHYATWAEGEKDEDGKIKNYTKTLVEKKGNVVVTKSFICTPNATYTSFNCEQSGEDQKAPDNSMEGQVFSASNNTLVFEDVTIGEGSRVYGGYVAGVDLRAIDVKTENNTVILRGNTQLEDDVMIYGGNSAFGHPTNKLIFDHNMVVDQDGNPISNQYVSFDKDKFANFDDVWTIQAGPDTRLEFTQSGVKALVELDQQADYDSNVAIIKAKTDTDLTNVLQDEQGRFDLTDTSIELANPKSGAYTFTLTNRAEDTYEFSVEVNKKGDPDNVETFGQVPLAGIALASEGTEMLNQTFKEAWTSESDLNVFVNGGYHDTRYYTGSGFDMRSEIAQVGIWKKFQSNWLGGLFAKYGHGRYESFPIHSEGDVNAYALGLMTSYYYSETGRIEGSAEIGKIDMNFDSDGLRARLKTSGLYFGLLAGVVQDISEDWEMFANLQFLHKAKDDVTDSLSEAVAYDSLQTATLRFGTNYMFSNIIWDGLVPSVGIMGLYEMLGKSDVSVAGLDNDSASLGGFSARAQARLTYHNESFFPIISELTAYGQVGRRRGWGGEANISFLF